MSLSAHIASPLSRLLLPAVAAALSLGLRAPDDVISNECCPETTISVSTQSADSQSIKPDVGSGLMSVSPGGSSDFQVRLPVAKGQSVVQNPPIRAEKVREWRMRGALPEADPLDSSISAASVPLIALDRGGMWFAARLDAAGLVVWPDTAMSGIVGKNKCLGASNLVCGPGWSELLAVTGAEVQAINVDSGEATSRRLDTGKHLLHMRLCGSVVVGWRDDVLGSPNIALVGVAKGTIETWTANAAVRFAVPFGNGVLAVVQEFLEKPQVILIEGGKHKKMCDLPMADLRDADACSLAGGGIAVAIVGISGCAVVRLTPRGECSVAEPKLCGELVRWNSAGDRLWIGKGDKLTLWENSKEYVEWRIACAITVPEELRAMDVSERGGLVAVAGVCRQWQWAQLWRISEK